MLHDPIDMYSSVHRVGCAAWAGVAGRTPSPDDVAILQMP